MTRPAHEAQKVLEEAASGREIPLDDVVEAASTISSRPSDDEARRLVALALRAAVVRGLDTDESGRAAALSRYARLATKFGAWTDAWNAASLRARLGPLENDVRAIRVVAFVHVFPSVARTHTKCALELMGPSPDPRWATFVLLRWLARLAGRNHDEVEMAEALNAVLTCRDAWLELGRARDVDDAWSAIAVDLARSADAPASTEVWARVMTRATRILADQRQSDQAAAEGDTLVTSTQESVAAGPGEARSFDVDDPADEIVRSAADAVHQERRRIWVVGAHAARHQLLGVARSVGLAHPSEVLMFLGYEAVKSKSLLAAIDPARDVGVILGAVPHNVRDLGANASLATALETDYGLDVVQVRQNSTSRDLAKITKTQFRKALRRLLAGAAPNVINGHAA